MEGNKIYKHLFSLVTSLKCIDSTTNNSFKCILNFFIAKNFKFVLGEVHSVRKLKSGDLLVEVSTATQSNILSGPTKTGSFSVSIEAHKALNFSRGVISVADLLHFTN